MSSYVNRWGNQTEHIRLSITLMILCSRFCLFLRMCVDRKTNSINCKTSIRRLEIAFEFTHSQWVKQSQCTLNAVIHWNRAVQSASSSTFGWIQQAWVKRWESHHKKEWTDFTLPSSLPPSRQSKFFCSNQTKRLLLLWFVYQFNIHVYSILLMCAVSMCSAVIQQSK